MKKIFAFVICLICLVTCFTGCKNTKDPSGKTKDPTKATASATAAVSQSASPSAPASDGTTALPEEALTPDPLASAGAEGTPTPTPVPTPTPTIRPAQLDSIVPAELLTTGYTTPLDPASVKFPKNYNMPYYIEVDVTNQCVNIFRKNTATGAYDILLNRFVCSGGTTTQPTKTGNFYIKTEEQQRAATGQSLKYTRYYFKKYNSYAYYVTRYSNEYMFHSFTFDSSNGKIVPKRAAYYNMGNAGSAGCLRMLMGHAKWIYENIDGGTYCVVNSKRAKDNTLRTVLKKYVPPLGWDMTPSWNGDKDNYTGLVRCDFVQNPEAEDVNPVTPTPTPQVTPTPTPTPILTPVIAPTQEPVPTKSPVVTPTATVKPTPTPTVKPTVKPTATPTVKPTPTPTATPTAKPTATPVATATLAIPADPQNSN